MRFSMRSSRRRATLSRPTFGTWSMRINPAFAITARRCGACSCFRRFLSTHACQAPGTMASILAGCYRPLEFPEPDVDLDMRILHVLDHSIPLQSGYSFRMLAILREQRALGWETLHLTSPR